MTEDEKFAIFKLTVPPTGDPERDIDQRLGRLRASLRGIGAQLAVQGIRLACDGCSARCPEAGQSATEAVTAAVAHGWTHSPDADYCPSCAIRSAEEGEL